MRFRGPLLYACGSERARCFFVLIITIIPQRNKRCLGCTAICLHARLSPHMSYYLFWVCVARKRTCGRPVRPRIVGSLHPALSRLTCAAKINSVNRSRKKCWPKIAHTHSHWMIENTGHRCIPTAFNLNSWWGQPDFSIFIRRSVVNEK